MNTTIISCIFFLLSFLPATAQEKPSPETAAFFNKAITEINPKHVTWVKSTAKSIKEKRLKDTYAKTMATKYGKLNKLNNLDIETLTFLVLMQVSKYEQEEMKLLMTDIKQNKEQKKKLIILKQNFDTNKINISRTELDSVKFVLQKQPDVQMVSYGKVKKPVKSVSAKKIDKKKLKLVSSTVTKPEIDKVTLDFKVKLDSLNEQGDLFDFLLQRMMDNLSKQASLLSNMLKKMSEASTDIIGNLK